ncbi:MAG TPA: ABC transporter ATP-binding protein [Patescibacteria group bacterium]|nr:ABC transporter ATP-binding protein [Patescibacteria group bacterium]
MPVISAKEISKIYETADATPVLSGVSLDIAKGESVAIIGKSGSGKSTFMHILATLDKPTTGSLEIDGADALKLSSRALDSLRNRKFGFVFQQFFLNGRDTSLDNVALPLVIAGVPLGERRRKALEMLTAVGLSEQAKMLAANLSGGQKQRLVIARALVTDPEVIFADEPTGNLDTENGKIVTDLLFGLQKEKGITLVIVTHDTDLAKLCDRVVHIKDGRIVA